ncbi:ABC-three component system protein [Arenibacter troitsensis]|uniref:ABC-three component systems C-terminal domain-containing protein n=1 Tax=Arenibacter troitsensis TaxID=188872 RepID=A0A1X7J7R3_9FLAO|nr:ABC-three component system protein [Arenibacter troitsensis]SMG23522.1 hypothetical protein SAMN03080602_01453 [Arenibacter troitsensis]
MARRITVGTNHGGINYFYRMAKNPSYLATVVNEVAKIPLEDTSDTGRILPFEIEEKIEHNNVIIYKRIITDYAFYSSLIHDTYEIISETNPNIRDRIMKLVHRKYLDITGQLILENSHDSILGAISKKGDYVIEKVLTILIDQLYESINFDNEISIEDMEMALEIIIGDAFFNCKILENPKF